MVVTNNFRIPPVLPERSLRAIYVLGGTYCSGPQVTTGPIGFASTARTSVNTAVIGVSCISEQGFAIAPLEEAAVSSGMIEVAPRTIMLADRAKFGVGAFADVACFADVEHLVTDVPPPGAIAAALEQAGVQMPIARSEADTGARLRCREKHRRGFAADRLACRCGGIEA